MKQLLMAIMIAAAIRGTYDVVEYKVDPPIEGSVFQSGTSAEGYKVYFTPEYIIDGQHVVEGDTIHGYYLHSTDDEGIFVGVRKWQN